MYTIPSVYICFMVPGGPTVYNPISLFLFQGPWRSNLQFLSVFFCFRVPGGPIAYNPFQFISVSGSLEVQLTIPFSFFSVSGSLEVQLHTILFSLFLFQGPWRSNCVQSLSVYFYFRVPGGPTVEQRMSSYFNYCHVTIEQY